MRSILSMIYLPLALAAVLALCACSTPALKTDSTAGVEAGAYWRDGPGFKVGVKAPSLEVGTATLENPAAVFGPAPVVAPAPVEDECPGGNCAIPAAPPPAAPVAEPVPEEKPKAAPVAQAGMTGGGSSGSGGWIFPAALVAVLFAAFVLTRRKSATPAPA